jgi:hypothetical protein
MFWRSTRLRRSRRLSHRREAARLLLQTAKTGLNPYAAVSERLVITGAKANNGSFAETGIY